MLFSWLINLIILHVFSTFSVFYSLQQELIFSNYFCFKWFEVDRTGQNRKLQQDERVLNLNFKHILLNFLLGAN